MAKSITQEERLLIKLVEKMPVSEEDKTAWLEQIRGGEMSEDLAETIRQKITAAEEGDEHAANRARYQVELANLIRRWRLSSQSQNFRRR